MMKARSGFLAGLLLGAVLTAGTAAAAGAPETVAAVRNTCPVYVDGERAEIAAYNIGGHNYFRLKDLAAYTGFRADWDGKTRSVLIRTGREEDPAEAGTVPDTPEPGDRIVCTDG